MPFSPEFKQNAEKMTQRDKAYDKYYHKSKDFLKKTENPSLICTSEVLNNVFFRIVL